MRKLAPAVQQHIAALDETWVEEAQELVKGLKGQDSKEGQLRNIQAYAEASDSWKALELFIRYQAARKQLPKDWAESAVKRLGALQNKAAEIASHVQGADAKAIHMRILSRVLGYAVRQHVWDVKGKEGQS